jgi:hypothetical protein
MKRRLFRTSAAILFCCGAGVAQADPIQWTVAAGGNGHFYEVIGVSGGLTWENARVSAMAAGGYLATITSAAENAFVFDLASGDQYWNHYTNYHGPYLGGYRSAPGSSAWQWVTGETWDYENWNPPQPDNPEVEHVLAYFGFGEGYGSHLPGTTGIVPYWGDIYAGSMYAGLPTVAYVVEYDTAPMPEPATLLLTLTGFALGARARRSRNRRA